MDAGAITVRLNLFYYVWPGRLLAEIILTHSTFPATFAPMT